MSDIQRHYRDILHDKIKDKEKELSTLRENLRQVAMMINDENRSEEEVLNFVKNVLLSHGDQWAKDYFSK